MLVDYHLYGTGLQNKIWWFLDNQHNWFMSSIILSSKSGIINTIFRNNYNQIMENTLSCSACHSEFVTNFFSKKLLIWDSKLNFHRKPCKINFENIHIFFDKSNRTYVISTLKFTTFLCISTPFLLHFMTHLWIQWWIGTLK